MCGRSRCALAPEEVIARAQTNTWQNRDLYNPSNNVSPGTATPVLHLSKDGQPIIHTMRWGLVPSFTKPTEKPDFWRMFNARSESIREKPSFRRLVPTRRCIVLLNGFFEWKKEEGGPGGKTKQPYYIYLTNEKTGEEEPMAMAGLWDVWHRGGGEAEKLKEEDCKHSDDVDPKDVLYTYTILTTESSPALQWLHDRMPVILKDEDAQHMWLDTTDKSSIDKLHSILGPYTGKNLKWHPVSRAMSNPAVQGPEAYQEIKKPSIQKFFQPRRGGGGGGGSGTSFVKVADVKKEHGETLVKKEIERNEAPVPDKTPNTDEIVPSSTPPSAQAPEAAKETAAASTTPGSDSSLKRKLPASSAKQTSSPASKKKKARPPDQPDIASFFSSNKKK